MFINIMYLKKSLAHMVTEVDLHPSHPGSSPHGRGFGFLSLKNTVEASPTIFLSKKYHVPIRIY
jgi:hypothetical protein